MSSCFHTFWAKRSFVVGGLALTMAVCVLVAGWRSYRAAEEATLEEFNQRQLVLAREAAIAIELHIETLAGHLGQMADGLGAFDEIGEDPKRTLEEWYEVLRPYGVLAVAVTDGGGDVVESVPSSSLLSEAFEPSKGLLEVGESFRSELRVGVHQAGDGGLKSGRIMVSAPIRREADVPESSAGLIVGLFRPERVIDRLIAPAHFYRRGDAFLIDHHSRVLWSPDSSLVDKLLSRRSIGMDGFEKTVMSMTRGEAGTASCEYFCFDGDERTYGSEVEEKLIAFAPIKVGQQLWSVGVWSPKRDAQRLLAVVYRRQVLFVLLAILVIALGSGWALASAAETNRQLDMKVAQRTRELKESHDRLVKVCDSVDANVHVADMDSYEVLFANQRVRETCGDIVGRRCWEVMRTGQDGPCDCCRRLEGASGCGEAMVAGKQELYDESTGHWYETRSRVIEWVDGRKVRLEVGIDVTERKAAEQLLQQRQDELMRMSRLKSMGEMATGLAHEINQPLFAIGNYAEGCLRRLATGVVLAEELRPIMEAIAVAAERAGQTIMGIKRFVGREAAQCRRVDANEVVRETMQLIGTAVEQKKVSVELRLAKELPFVFGDATQMEQVVLNLVQNGLEAMEGMVVGERVLTIETADAVGGQVEITVQDSGASIGENIKRRLFEPFTTTKQKGMGMGLAISRSIIEAHGGQLVFMEGEKMRKAFRIRLPRDGDGCEHND